MDKYVILGCGWAGITFAIELKRNFPTLEVIVLEKSNTPGGLLNSVKINNHFFDIGGSHVIFSHNKSTLQKLLAVLGKNSVSHQRNTKVLLNSIFVPYPLENGLYVLSPEERAEALICFLEVLTSRAIDWTPKTFKDWIYGFFGKWIAEKYLIPYNEKIWKRPLDAIDVDWIYTPGRLPIPDWRDVVKSAAGIPTVGYVEQSLFYYPKCGGIQALFDSAAKEAKKIGVKIVNNVEVSKIKRTKNEWIINDEIKARKLASTIPLKELVKALDAPKEVMKASEELDYNKIAIVGIALKKAAPDQHWIYVPDSSIIFHRYAWISNYSPKNSPRGESTILAEITLPPNAKVSTKELVDKTVTDLENLNVLKQKEILFTKAWLHEYGYPIYKVGHREKREKIMSWLREQNVVSVGRWGSWHYWNMDKTYEETIKEINFLKASKTE
ncbi:MAG: protoporphyrinogen/coproporphyrinogen oxidase [Candidatus Bathyarchaeales archaeon]